MKILMMVPVWRRPEILAMFVKHMERNRPHGIELRPVFILSPDDPDFDKVQWLTRRYDCFTYKNYPLGEKMNAGVDYCKRFDWTYMMNMGSDNIWTAALWALYESWIGTHDFFGINDFHVMNALTSECAVVRGYNTGPDDKPAPIGAGRMIHRALINECSELYRPEWNWGMDGASMWTLWEAGHRPKVVETNGAPVLLNIMTRTNLTQWEELDRVSAFVNYFDVRAWFGLDDFGIIDTSFSELERRVLRLSQVVGSQRAAFDQINAEHRAATGEEIYKNYDVYKAMAYKRRQS